MQERRQEILSSVAAGRLSPEEGAARLAALADGAGSARSVTVLARAGIAEVVGDPEVSEAQAIAPEEERSGWPPGS